MSAADTVVDKISTAPGDGGEDLRECGLNVALNCVGCASERPWSSRARAKRSRSGRVLLLPSGNDGCAGSSSKGIGDSRIIGDLVADMLGDALLGYFISLSLSLIYGTWRKTRMSRQAHWNNQTDEASKRAKKETTKGGRVWSKTYCGTSTDLGGRACIVCGT